MVRYNYNQQVQPPAPFIYVAVVAPDQTARVERIPALIDTGADITVIPRKLITDLGLIKFSEIGVRGFRLRTQPLDTFLVRLHIHDWEIEALEVIAEDESHCLLGRDLLNQFLITLDGPGLSLEIRRSAKETIA